MKLEDLRKRQNCSSLMDAWLKFCLWKVVFFVFIAVVHRSAKLVAFDLGGQGKFKLSINDFFG